MIVLGSSLFAMGCPLWYTLQNVVRAASSQCELWAQCRYARRVLRRATLSAKREIISAEHDLVSRATRLLIGLHIPWLFTAMGHLSAGMSGRLTGCASMPPEIAHFHAHGIFSSLAAIPVYRLSELRWGWP